MTTTSHFLRRCGIAAVAGLLAGCATGQTAEPTPYTVVAARGILPPAEPDSAVVLRISGDIAEPGGVELDMERLEAIGLVEYEVVDEQATGRTAAFRGVLLRDLLDAVGADDDATNLHLVALNDYAVDIPITDTEDYPVILATQIDGERMSIADYGPTRVIYPYHAAEFERAIYDPLWIWQLAAIEVG